MAIGACGGEISLRRSTRPTNEHNYQLLNNGPSISTERVSKKTWSTTKLYSLEIVDSKLVGEQLLVRVHYTYKEWDSAA